VIPESFPRETFW